MMDESKLSESQISYLTPFRCAQPPLSIWRGAKNRQVLGVRFALRRTRFALKVNFRDSLKLLERIMIDPAIFGGKPIIRGRRLAVEHILGMFAAGDTPETILEGYKWLEMDDGETVYVYRRPSEEASA